MQLPNIWGVGNIFAFSGIEGECTKEKCLCGTLSGDRIGINFITKSNAALHIETYDVKDISYVVVASDIIKGTFTTNINEKFDFEILMIAQSAVYIRVPLCGKLCIRFSESATVKSDGNLTVYNLEDEKYALYGEANDGYGYYVFAYGKDAEKVCKEYFTFDINKEVSKKLSYFNELPIIDGLNEDVEKLYYKSFSVLKSMIYSPEGMFQRRWSTPDKIPHKDLYLWDSAFHSIALKYISYDLAKETLLSVLDSQKEDGMIPHRSNPQNGSDITQPPILAWAIMELYKESEDISLLEETYDRLKKYVQWNMENRDANKNYLYEWYVNDASLNCRCDESGMDNSPRFDDVTKMDSIDFSCFMANEVKSLSNMAKALDRPGEHLYWDVIFDRIKKAINDVLYCKEDKFYYDVLLSDGSFKKVKAVSSFLPLFAGVCEKDVAHDLVNHLKDEFDTPFAIPSVAKDDKTYGTDMWRGPVWINYNYMISEGLRKYGYKNEADEIVKSTIAMISKWYKNDGTIYEFYDSENEISPSRLNRKGEAVFPYMPKVKMQAIKDFGWSSALVAEMILKSAK